MTITLSTATLIYVASCVVTIGAAIKVLLSAKTALLKPLEDINKRLDDHDKFLKNDKEHLEKIDYVLADLTDGFVMLVQTHKVALEHLQDGNHTGEIKEAIDEIDKWLLKGKQYGR